MCLNTSRILVIDAPEHRMAKLSSKFPVGNFPSMYGWLVHVNTSLQWLQADLMVSIVPDCDTERCGLLEKHQWQVWNKMSCLDRNTIPFGSSR